MAGIDQPDTLVAAAVVDGKQVAAGQGEDRVDAAGPSRRAMSWPACTVGVDGASMLISVAYPRLRVPSPAGISGEAVGHPREARRLEVEPKPFSRSINWSAAFHGFRAGGPQKAWGLLSVVSAVLVRGGLIAT